MLSAEGLITLERVTLEGTKIKAHAGSNTFRRQETLEAHLQLVTDAAQGLIVNVEATTDAVDHHQLAPALEGCEQTLGRLPEQVVADGDYTHHASVEAANCGVDFYVSWQESWKPGERDAPRPQRRVSRQRVPL